MIITANLPPEKNLYYLGGKVLEILEGTYLNSYDVNFLYNEIKKTDTINISSLIYSLDWLFILNLITPNSDGSFSRCF